MYSIESNRAYSIVDLTLSPSTIVLVRTNKGLYRRLTVPGSVSHWAAVKVIVLQLYVYKQKFMLCHGPRIQCLPSDDAQPASTTKTMKKQKTKRREKRQALLKKGHFIRNCYLQARNRILALPSIRYIYIIVRLMSRNMQNKLYLFITSRCTAYLVWAVLLYIKDILQVEAGCIQETQKTVYSQFWSMIRVGI